MRKILAVVAGLLVLPAPAQAIDRVQAADDAAPEYSLTERGELVRMMGKHRCSITTGVSEFRVARHPHDDGIIYFVQDGDLKVLVPPVHATGVCPRPTVRTVASDVKKYALVSDPHSAMVVLTVDGDDRFQAVGPQGVVDVSEVRDFGLNPCFGEVGKKFSNFAAFVIDRYGLVTKLKGNETGERTDFKRAYVSLDEFRSVNGVCAPQ